MSLRAIELDEADKDRFYVMHIDLTNGDVYAAAYNTAAVNALAAATAPDGLAPSSEGTPVTEDVDKGLSFAVDNRVVQSSPSLDSDGFLSKIGRLHSSTGGCSATMFSRAHIFTAAHCTWGSAGWANPYSFIPRQRGLEMSGNPIAPYGTATPGYLQYPSQWTANGCNTSAATGPCHRYDLAVMGFTPTDLSPNPGYVGFGYLTNSQIAALPHVWNVGYPGCSNTNPEDNLHPNPCSVYQQYEDAQCAYQVSTFQDGTTANAWPYDDGTDPTMNTGCDTSGGHSGGPVFSSTGYMVANTQHHVCNPCTASQGMASGGTRINLELFNWMMVFRNQYP